MAEDLTTILTDGAQSAEDEQRLAGQAQNALIVDPNASVDNPDGSTPVGSGVDNTGTEQAPGSEPPAVNVTAGIPGPETYDTGGSGGLFVPGQQPAAPTNEPTAPQDPVLTNPVQTGVAPIPSIPEEAPPEAPPAPNNPPTVAVLPGTPAIPPEGGEPGPGDDDNIFNDQLRSDPNLTLPPGGVAELGLENGYGALATTQGTIVINDPDGIQDIATVTIAGRTYSLADLNALDPADPRYQIDLEAGDGDATSEGTLVLERFDPTTGEIFFRFDLKTPVDNDVTDNPNINENSALIPIPVSVTDSNGATATAEGAIRVVDATPDVVTSALAGAPDPFVSDDDALGAPIVNNYADNFAASFNPGSDGESGRSTSYDLSLGEGSTGLFDLDGNEIVFSQNPETGLITGIANGVSMFTISVDGLGDVTLTQLQPLRHLDAEGDPTDSLSLPAGLINLTRTDTLSDTDGDTDVSSATIDISSGFTFLDSEPEINNATTVSKTAYEDALAVQGNGTETVFQVTFDAADLASQVKVGADNPVTYSFDVANNTSTGLTQDGKAILYYNDGGKVYGVVDADNSGIISSTELGAKQVFEVSYSSASGLTFKLLDNVDHANASGDGGVKTLDLASIIKATDLDGDFVNLGTGLVVNINNDVPQNNSETVTAQTVYEDGLFGGNGGLGETTTSVTYTGASLAALVSPGADAPVSFSLNTNLTGDTGLTQDGHTINWSYDSVAGSIKGVDATDSSVVFTIAKVGSDFTFTLNGHIDNGTGDANNTSLDIAKALIATDTDGDKVTLDNGLVVNINNDVPTNNSATVTAQTVYEDALAGGNGGVGETTTSVTYTGASLAALVNAGADAPVSFSLNTNLTGDTGLTQDGHTINWSYDSVAGNIKGVDATDSSVVFTIAKVGSDFTFTLNGHIDNGTGDANNTSLDIAKALIATDTDGDKVTLDNGLVVNINNDVPTNNSATVTAQTVYEDALAGGNGGVGETTTSVTYTGASLAALVNAGADAPVSFSLNTNLTGDTGLTQDGHTINWSYDSVAGNIKGVDATDSSVVFTIAKVGSDFTFTLNGHIDNGTGDANNTSLDIAKALIATDTDGDKVTLDNGLVVNINNDVPTNNSATVTAQTVYEDALAGGNGGVGETTTSVTYTGASLAALVNAGADAPVSFSLNTNLTGDTGLTQDGHTINWSYDSVAGNIKGVDATDSSVVFTIAKVGSDFTFTLNGHIDNGTGDANNTSLDIAKALIATDTDGDKVTLDNGLVVNINNDVPTNNSATVTAQTVYEDALAGGNGGVGETTTSVTYTGASLAALVNAGADAPVSFSLNTNLTGDTGLTQDGHTINWSYDSVAGNIKGVDATDSSVVFTIAKVGSDFTFTLNGHIDNGTGDANNTSLDIAKALIATDTDGDKVTLDNGLVVNINNDVPTNNSATVTAQTVYEDALAGGNGGVGETTTSVTYTGASLAALVNAGADAPVSFSLNTNLTGDTGLTQDGHTINWSYDSVAGNIKGVDATDSSVVFTIAKVGSDFTFTLNGHIDNGTGDANNTSLDIAKALIATDTDGDKVTLDNGLVVNINNDVPQNNSETVTAQTVYEDGLFGGNGGLGETTTSVTYTGASLAALVSPGADAPVSFSLNTAITGSTGLTQDGNIINWSYDSSGNGTIKGIDATDNSVVFTIAKVGSDFTFTLNGHIDNGTGDANNTSLDIAKALIATDTDGDKVTLDNGLVVNINNDVPQNNSETVTAQTVYEDGLFGGNGGLGETTTSVTYTGASLAALVSPGADAPVSFSLNTAITGSTGLTQDGNIINWSYDSSGNGTIKGIDATDNSVVFTIAKVGSDFTFTLNGHIDNGTGDANNTSLDIAKALIATDTDGDKVTLDNGLVVNINNDVPQNNSETVTAQTVYEDGLFGGNGGLGETTTSVTYTGASLAALVSPGADAPVSFSLNTAITGSTGLTQDGNIINWSYDSSGNGTIKGIDATDNSVVFTIAKVGSDFTFTLNGHIDNGTGDANNTSLDIAKALIATDTDGDKVTLDNGLVVNINNDVPQNNSETVTAQTVYEDGLFGGNGGLGETTTSVTYTGASLAALVSPGADAPVSFSLNTNLTGDTGLTQDGHTINWSYDSVAGNIKGVDATDSSVVFTIAKVGSDFTFTLNGHIDNGTGDANNTSLDIAKALIATDTDGDKVTLDNGLVVNINNDVPTNNSATVTAQTVYEDALAGGNGGVGETTTSVTYTGASLAALVNAGADAPVSFSLNTNLTGDTGLTQDGHTINWSYDSVAGNIKGVDATDSSVVFTIAKVGSDFTFTLNGHIDNGTGDANNTSLDIAKALIATDTDGDKVTLDNGLVVNINNDVPTNNSATVTAQTVYEDALAGGNGGVGETTTSVTYTGASLAALVNAGADAPVSFSLNTNLTGDTGLTQDGHTINWSYDSVAGSIKGVDATDSSVVFTIAKVGSDFTFTLNGHIDNGTGDANNTSLDIAKALIATDTDGDKVTLDNGLVVNINNDVPQNNSETVTAQTVYEDGLFGGNGGLGETTTSVTYTGASLAALVSPGADAPVSFSLNTNLTGDTGLTQDGHTINWSYDSVAGSIKGVDATDSSVVFTIAKVGSDFTFTLNGHIDNGTGDANNTSLDIAKALIATDTDGDKVTLDNGLVVNINNDVPTNNSATVTAQTVYEDALAGGNGGVGETTTSVTYTGASLAALVNAGADAPVSFSLNTNLTGDTGLTQDGHTINWSYDSVAGSIKGVDATDSSVVFTIAKVGSDFTFTLNGHIDNGTGDANNTSLDIAKALIATDTDGDKVTLDNGLVVNINNDVPTNNSATVTAQTVYEDALAGGNGGVGETTTSVTYTGASLAALVNAGADAPVSFSLNTNLTGDTGLTQDGHTINWSYDSVAGNIKGVDATDSSVVFTIAKVGSDFTFTLNGHIDNGTGDANNTSLDIAKALIATDTDGDKVTLDNGLVVNINNDVPTNNSATVTAQTVYEDALAGGNGGVGETTTSVTYTGASLAALVNAGADAPVSFSLNTNLTGDTGLTQDGHTINWSYDSVAGNIKGVDATDSSVVFTIAKVGSDFTFTLNGHIDNGTGDANNTSLDIAKALIATDTDGDKVTLDNGLVVNINNDVPQNNSETVTAQTVYEDGLFGGNGGLGETTTSVTYTGASLAALVSPGADAPVSFSLNTAITGSTGLTQDGNIINWSYDSSGNGTIKGIDATDNSVVFTIAKVGSDFTFTLNGHIDNGTGDANNTSLDIAKALIATDTDGDKVTLDNGLVVNINNDVPQNNSETVTAQTVYEDGLFGGNGGLGETTTSVTYTGASLAALVSPGADAPVSFSLNTAITGSTGLTQDGNIINWSYDSSGNGTIKGIDATDNSVVFTIAKVGSDFTFTLNGHIDNGTGDANNTSLDIAKALIATDTDGDKVTLDNGLVVNINNDVPQNNSETVTAQTVYEDGLFGGNGGLGETTTSVTYTGASLAALVSPGADAPVSFSLNTAITGSTGLTQDGNIINWSYDSSGNGTIKGIDATDNSVVFTIAKVGSDFTFTLNGHIDNGTGDANNTSLDIAKALIATDTDGDKVTLDNGLVVNINNDVPQNNSETVTAQTVYEDGLFGGNGGLGETTTSVTYTGASLAALVSPGADAPVSFSLNTNLTGDTGLTQDGHTINWSYDSVAGSIKGVDATDSSVVFTIAKVGSDFTFTLNGHIDNGTGDANNTSLDIAKALIATDTDGDKVTLDNGLVVNINNDVPTNNSATVTAQTVYEDALAGGNGGVGETTTSVTYTGASLAALVNAGADAPVSFSLNTNLTGDTGLTQDGHTINWSYDSVAGNIKGVDATDSSVVFTIAKVGSDFTFTLNGHIDNGTGDANNTSLDIAKALIATDTDGDKVTLDNGLVVNINNDVPTNNSATVTAQTVYEDALAGGNGGVGETTTSVTYTGASLAALVSPGADAPVSFSLNTAITGSTGLTQDGNIINWSYDSSGNGTIKGIDATDNSVVFTIAKVGSDFTFTLNGHIDNGTGDANNTSLDIAKALIATDTDGDKVTLDNGLVVNINNDVPQNNSETVTAQTVYEDGLFGGNGGLGETTTSVTYTGASLAALVSPGADAPVSFSLNTNLTGDTGLTQDGHTINWSYDSVAGSIKGVDATDSSVVFTIAKVGSDFTFTLNGHIDNGTGDANNTSLDIAKALIATDTDGDKVTLDNGLVVNINNDVPTNNSATVTAQTVYEDALAGGNGGVGETTTSVTYTGASLAALVNAGADAPVSFSLNTNLTGDTGLTQDGHTINWSYDSVAGNIKGVDATDSSVVFTIAKVGSDFTFTLNGHIDNGTGDANNTSLDIAKALIATDTDGDKVTLDNGLVVNINNDVPTNNSATVTAQTVYEDALAGGNGGVGETTTSVTYTGASLAALVNAGADAPVSFSLNTNLTGDTGLTQDGHTINWSYDSVAGNIKGVDATDSSVVFTIAKVGSDFTFTLNGHIDNGTGDANNTSLDIAKALIATDTDGDKVTLDNGLVVNINNDVPQNNSETVTAQTVYEDGLFGGNGGLGETTTSVTYTGASLAALVSPGADAPVSFSLNTAITGSTGLTQDGNIINWSYDSSGNGTIKGIDATDNSVVFTIAKVGSDFTFTLNGHIDNGTGDANNTSLDIAKALIATDTDGDKVTLDNGLVVNINNDVPQNNSETVTAQTVYEDGLFGGNGGLGETTTSVTYTGASLAALVSPGADAPVSFSLNTAITGSTGLTQDGNIINWSYDSSGNGTIKGIDATDNSVVFTIAKVGSDFTFTLNGHIDNGTGDANNTSLDIAKALIATDTDGDKVTLDNGLVVNINNDVPQNNSETVTAQTVYEDGLFGGNGGLGETTTSVTYTGASLAALVSPGADAPVSFSLNTAITGSTGLTQDGNIINWSYDSSGNGTIKGIDATDNSVVFTIAKVGSDFTFTLNGHIDNGTGDANNTSLDIAKALIATDTDGDKVTLDNGLVVNINNDVPQNNSETVTAQTVYEDGLFGGNGGLGETTTSVTYTGASLAALVSPGADAPVSFSLNTNLTGDTGLTQDGHTINWSYDSVAGSIKGVDATDSSVVFTIAKVGSDFTFTLNGHIDNGTGDANNTSLDIAKALIATDTDGDKVTLDNGLVVNINNDVPTNNSATVTAQTVYEDALAGGNGGVGETTTSVTYTGASLAALVNAGADAPVSFSLNTNLTGDTGLTQDGHTINWSYDSVAGNIKGVDATDSSVVFTIAKVGSDFTFTLNGHIDNGTGDANNTSLDIAKALIATDTDGDKVTLDNGLVVNINNDVPTNNSATVTAQTVYEDALAGGNGGVGETTTSVTYTGASLAALVNAGADAPVSFSLNTNLTGDTGLTQDGHTINWSYDSVAGNIKGVDATDSSVVFTIAKVGSDFTFTLNGHIDNGTGDANNTSLDIAKALIATDTDGDKVTLDNGLVVNINNDVPQNNSETVTAQTVYEDGLFGGNGGLGETTTSVTYTGASLAALVSPGADAPVSFSLNTNLTGDTGLTQDGHTINWSYDSVAGSIKGVDATDSSVVFTIAKVGSDFTFTLNGHIDNGTGDANNTSLDIAKALIATDTDGDKVTLDNGLVVNINNDVPTLGPIQAVIIPNAVASVTGSYSASIGADGYYNGSFYNSFSLTDTSVGTYTLFHSTQTDSTGSYTTYYTTVDNSSNGTHFYDITFNTSGSYTFSLVTPRPPTTGSSGDLISSGITGGSNLTSYTFGSAQFNNAFDLTLTGYYSNGTTGTVTISATELGVNGNTVQKSESLRLDIVQKPGFESSTIASVNLGLATTAGYKAGDQLATFAVYKGSDGISYTTSVSNLSSSTNTLTVNLAALGSPSGVPSGVTLTLDYIQVKPIDGNFKVVDLALNYTYPTSPADIPLAFNSQLKDADGDVTPISTFTVNLAAGTAGNDIISVASLTAPQQISGLAGNDKITGGSGNDKIIGGVGADTMTGGAGADQFIFLKGQGSSTDTDTITDFVKGVDTIVISGTAITGVSVSSGSTVGTTTSYTITVTYSDADPETFKVALQNGGTLNDAGKTQASGVVVSGSTATIDGTIVGATVYIDINHDGVAQANEVIGISNQLGHIDYVVDLAQLDTNGDGNFVIGEARAVLSGGTDVDTNLTYEINLFGPAGSSVITPLTSLLQTLLESGSNLASANAVLAQHLGLPVGTEFNGLNPIEGNHQVLVQNGAVMTAVVQFSELAALNFGTDEAHASYSVFQAISTALTALPDGQVADFSDPALLQSISSHLGLSDFAGGDVMQFMLASQNALQHSIDSLQPGDDALAAISAVQHLTQGSYAEVLESVASGDLSVHALDDLTHTLTAYSQGEININQLGNFDQALTTANADHQITDLEFTQALSTVPGHTDPAALALLVDDVHSLVSSYLGTLAADAESTADGLYDGTHSTGELAYHLDSQISDFIETHGLSDAAYAEIHQGVMDHIAHDLNDVMPGTDADLAFNDQGHVANDAAVLAALDQHFHEVLDLHNGFDSVAYHDVVSPDHTSV